MGEAERKAEIYRISAETAKEIEVIKGDGGTVKFIFEYLQYLNDLRATNEGQPTIAVAGKRFRQRPIQMSAIGAMMDMATMESFKNNIESFRPEHTQRLETAARAAYVSAAGHFEKKALNNLPETGGGSHARREKAAADWDRLIKSDPNSLIHLTMFGDEPSKSEPITRLEIVKGIGGFISLIAFAVGAYYLLSR